MTAEERGTFLKGRGCPSCHGVKPAYCELEDNENLTRFLSELIEETDDDPLELLDAVE